MSWYETGPDAPKLIAVAAAMAIFATALDHIVPGWSPLMVTRATLQALLAALLLVELPTAVTAALRSVRSGPLSWLLFAIGLAALAALMGAAEQPFLVWGRLPDPRVVAIGGLVVVGAVYAFARWLVILLVSVVGMSLRRRSPRGCAG